MKIALVIDNVPDTETIPHAETSATHYKTSISSILYEILIIFSQQLGSKLPTGRLRTSQPEARAPEECSYKQILVGKND